MSFGRPLLKPINSEPEMVENASVANVRNLIIEILHAVYQRAQYLLHISARMTPNVAWVTGTFTLYEDEVGSIPTT